ncbi:hypothetical protein QTJ16_004765 [Diplocarpon rosae]|uniref:Cation/H+ exchanger transmembrane domain-containing protein n=1 Tax=Diplocarpon rosae TaxID=946125 RepID=A0AAD9SYG1_9HELO|nr:hypothetical protein QTJ16_004765 [Diplocarpon rosae]PBP24216.1 hypothetical protein BUE80_DR004817 [Diplocarpon rosae]
MPYLPYHEPGITTILSLASFLFLLNSIRYILDRLLYCGIIGEILIGIVWGQPVGGTSWLSAGTQDTVQAYGYLGLIGLVFEGGLRTDLGLLQETVFLSISVATIGLLMPIALSFVLLALPFSGTSGTAYPSPLAAFSAGASLCSTSLGTTFAILTSAGMQRTKVGVVLVGAAMMDDVVGLVMVNIVTTLGSGGTGVWPIARPVVASFGLFIVTLLLGPYVLKPAWRFISAYTADGAEMNARVDESMRATARRVVRTVPHMGFVLSTAVLVAYVTIAAFIDGSVLFAAFLAGGVVNSLWSISSEDFEQHGGAPEMYELYYQAPMDYILVPFFFASIGFSIPITEMFRGSIVWKGIVYSILMIIGKCLVSIVIYLEYFARLRYHKPKLAHREPPHLPPEPSLQVRTPQAEQGSPQPPHTVALLVGLAMTARGEIGFLIASLSQSSGTLTLQRQGGHHMYTSGEEVLLVIIWAVVVCTIVGPIGVGIIVRRIRQYDGTLMGGWI